MSRSPLNKFLGIATLVLALQAVLFYSASSGEKMPLSAPLSLFPFQFANWHVHDEGVVDDETRQVLKADDLLTRWYEESTGAGVNLFIAYFQTQRTGQAPHSPKNCLPGSGWQPSESGVIDVPAGSDILKINRYVVERGEDKSVVLYWYQSQGRVIAGEFAAKYFLIEDSIRKHRSDTSLVRIVVPAVGGNDRVAEATAIRFAQAAYPVIKSYLPQ